MKCLVVEDDRTTSKLIQAYLSDYFTCTAVDNGKDAVKAVQRGFRDNSRYDLICMDIMMPEQDGQETLRQIRSLERKKGIKASDNTKVVMVTALDNIRHIQTAFNSGCEAYMTKPVKKEEILQKIRKLGLIN